MFLNELNKEESRAFLGLVTKLANIDDVFAKEERKLVNEYMEELNLSDSPEEILEYDEVISILKDTTTRKKSIIYFELVGLALVDGEYGDKEIDFLDKIAYDLDIPRYKKIAFANYFVNFKDIYNFSVVEYENKIEY